MPTNYGSLPFKESITFFRDKLDVSTEHWTDVWQEQHAASFSIAGAVKSDLLSDMRTAVDKAIANGTTLAEFRKDFASIVNRHGWQYNGGFGWRSRVIYETNVRQSYNAGRWQQIERVKSLRPYLIYRHGDSENPRELHVSWDKTVLKVDDPWWETHYPQNGWGCQCKAFTASKKDLERMGLEVSEQAPNDGDFEWTNPKTGEIRKVPNGIDPGFAYNVGKAKSGESLSRSILDNHRDGNWEDLPTVKKPDNLSPSIQAKPSSQKLGAKISNTDKRSDLLSKAIGDDALEIIDPSGDRVLINESVIKQIAQRAEVSEQYFPFVRSVIESPQETWVNFVKNVNNDQTAIKRRYIKALIIGGAATKTMVVELLNGTWVDFKVFDNMTDALAQARLGERTWFKE